jgi:hypothetical protein
LVDAAYVPSPSAHNEESPAWISMGVAKALEISETARDPSAQHRETRVAVAG